MRLLLDANLSGRAIASSLRADGHDVSALSDHSELEGLEDADVLALAASDERILITRNSKDFAPLLRQWADEGRLHAGCILIWTLDHQQFAAIVAGIRGLLADRPAQHEWRDLAVAL